MLPTESYGLKPVSMWLGFECRNTRSGATQSMLWYRLWLETGDRQYLDDSVIYNEDDCRATRFIKDWVLVIPDEHVVFGVVPVPSTF